MGESAYTLHRKWKAERRRKAFKPIGSHHKLSTVSDSAPDSPWFVSPLQVRFRVVHGFPMGNCPSGQWPKVFSTNPAVAVVCQPKQDPCLVPHLPLVINFPAFFICQPFQAHISHHPILHRCRLGDDSWSLNPTFFFQSAVPRQVFHSPPTNLPHTGRLLHYFLIFKNLADEHRCGTVSWSILDPTRKKVRKEVSAFCTVH